MTGLEYIIILVTAGSNKEAAAIAREVVGRKLAACVTIVPSVRSVYTWNGKVRNSKEHLLVIKTRGAFFHKVEKAVKRLHSYECPEVVALRLMKGSPDYLNWIQESTEIKS